MHASSSIQTLTTTAALLLLPACVLDQKLGETAEGSSDSGEPASTDTATPTDPSATSGQPPTTVGSGVAESSSSAGTDESGGEPPPGCAQGEDFVYWHWDFGQPLPGIFPDSVAVLEGPCTLQGMFEGNPGGGAPQELEIYLECSMSGRFDEDMGVVDMPLSPVIEIRSALPPQNWLPFLEGGELRLRTVIDWWGQNYSRYLVLHRGGQLVLAMADAEHVDPTVGTPWAEDIDTLLGGEPWHDTLMMSIQDSECGTELGDCGQSPRALEIDWRETEQGVLLHDAQGGSVPTTVRELSYDAWVTSAQDLSAPLCTDTSLGDYRYAVWAVEP